MGLAQAQSYQWTQFTGSGFADGTGFYARFSLTGAIALGSNGRLLVGDGNNTFRTVTTTGVVTTPGGGFAATGLAIDPSSDTIYASYSHSIYVVTATGTQFVLAGGASGSTDGSGSSARFNTPAGVALAPDGYLYVADSGNHTIRKVSPYGMVITFAGTAGSSGSADGTGASARFRNPRGITVDALGNVYVADTGNHMVRKISPSGVVTSLAGYVANIGSADGKGVAAQFNGPKGIAVDASGTLFVTDTGNGTVRRITPAGVVTTLAGKAGAINISDGTGSNARLWTPDGIVIGGASVLYVTDYTAQNIRKVTTSGVVTTLAGSPLSSSAQTVAVHSSGDMVVVDSAQHTVTRISTNKTAVSVYGELNVSGSADGSGSKARFNFPSSAAFDASGNIYVADGGNHTIRKINPAGVVTTLAGSSGMAGAANGTGVAARFNSPLGIVADSAANLYVSDQASNTIRKITPAGLVSTFAGSPGVSGSDDGLGNAARFNVPYGFAIDANNNVIVADSGNGTLRHITPSGNVTTIAGVAGVPGSEDGSIATARLSYPIVVAAKLDGTLFVSERVYPFLIRQISPNDQVSTINWNAEGIGVSADGDLLATYAGQIHIGHLIAPDISVKQVGGPTFVDGSGVAAFGSVPTGATISLTIEIKNMGDDTLSGLVVNKDGAHEADFTVSALSITDLAPGEATTFTVDFAPGALGNRTAALHIDSNDPDENPFDFFLKGTGCTAPAFATHPAAQIISTGAPVTFNCVAVGTGPFTYQWRKNGVIQAGANADSLTLPSARAMDAGSYAVQVKNANGSALSKVATLAVVDPADRQIVLSKAATATLTVNVAGSGLSYAWFMDGNPLITDGRMTGWGTKSLTIPDVQLRDTGIYTCAVTGPGGTLVSGSLSLIVIDLAPQIVTPVQMPPGIVSGDYNFQIPVNASSNRTPASYAATGLPTGLSINTVTGEISGKPKVSKGTPYSVVLTATNAKGKSTATASLLVSPLPSGTVGVFNGLVSRQSGIAGGAQGGRLDLTTTATGQFSGKLTLGTAMHNFTGVLNAEVGVDSPTGLVMIPRTANTTLTLSFAIDRSQHRLTAARLTDGAQQATVTGWRNLWSTAVPATEYAGYYTLGLEIPVDKVDDEAIPQGQGFASFTVANAGTMIVTGKLADGTAFSTSGTLGPLGEVMVYQTSSATTDSVLGLLTIDVGTEGVFDDSTLTGSLNWTRELQLPAERVYQAGFAPFDLTAVGGRYVAPGTSAIVMDLPDNADNAILDFIGAGVGSAESPVSPGLTLRIRAAGVINLPASNPRSTMLTVTPSSGTFNGGFTLVDPNPAVPATDATRSTTYQGMIVRHADGLSGFGFFLMQKLPTTLPDTVDTTPKLSGQVVLEPAF